MRLQLLSLLSAFSFVLFISCDRDLIDGQTLYTNNNIVMSGAQETPAVNTAATGKVVAQYDKETRILSYTVTWSGLTANATAAHIHGIAEPGVAAGVVQGFSGFPAATSGSYTGFLLADGTNVKEENILAGRYYVNIHTSTFPGGEIRGQITF